MKKLAISLSSGLITAVAPLIASAQGQTVFGGQKQLPKGNVGNLYSWLVVAERIANWLFTALLILAVIMIVIAAFRYLFATGNDDRIKKANQGLLYAAVAIAVGLLAQAIVFIVAQIVGTPIS